MGAQVDITDVMIQPQKTTPPLDASKWPLLLKNYDKLNVRRALGCFMRLQRPAGGPLRKALGFQAMNWCKLAAAGPHWALHAHSDGILAAEAASLRLRPLRRHQPRQAGEPLLARGARLNAAAAVGYRRSARRAVCTY